MTDWRPIATAPTCEAVIVSDGTKWTLGRRAWVSFQTLQFRWPFIKNGGDWSWVFANTNGRMIDFEPTHWTPGPDSPPHANQQTATEPK